jgi:hypothetical protein
MTRRFEFFPLSLSQAAHKYPLSHSAYKSCPLRLWKDQIPKAEKKKEIEYKNIEKQKIEKLTSFIRSVLMYL